MKKSTQLITIGLLFCGLQTFSTTYFVSNSGNNANTGLSLAQAFLTLQKGADVAVAGDSVLVADGTYAGFDFRNKNGTAADRVVFLALGTNVLINTKGPIRNDGINIENADYITVDGFIVNDMINGGNGIRLVNSDFCEVRNCRCDNNAERGIFTGFTNDILIEHNVCTNSVDEHGIYVSNSSDRPIVRFNTCYGNNNIGIHFNGDLSAGGDGIISDAMVYGNVIYDNNLAAGINMDGCLNPLIFNNLIYNNHFAQGIALFQQDGAISTQGAKIFNNTIIVPTDGRWGILVRDDSHLNTQIYNNIILNFHAWWGCIATESIVQFASDYNLLHNKVSATGDGSTIPLSQWQALGLDTHSQLAGSLTDIFENPGASDYHLADNSQAIDTGTAVVSPVVPVDLAGTPRPLGSKFDIGCYEFVPFPSHIEVTASSIEVYPNPTQDYVIINGNFTNFNLKVLDINGQVVMNLTGANAPATISLNALQPGLHFLLVEKTGNQLLCLKTIIKQ
jgi:parallel beta-helix repeat protein